MNWDEIAGAWDQFRGKVRQQWGKLTDDDLTSIKGKKDELLGKLRQRYGYTQERAEEELTKFTDSCDNCATDDDVENDSSSPSSSPRSSTRL